MKLITNIKSITGFITFICCLSFSTVKAEYSGQHIAYKIYTNSGTTIHAFTYLPEHFTYKVPAKKLKAHLQENYTIMMSDGTENLYYYSNRLSYKYQDGIDSQSVIYKLINKETIKASNIKKVEIIEMINFTYLMGISNHLSEKDLAWMQTKLVKKAYTNGYLCSYELFIHENSEAINSILNEIKAYEENYELQRKELEEEMKNSDGEAYYTAEDTYNKLQNNIDEEISEFIGRLSAYKVLIIQFCSC